MTQTTAIMPFEPATIDQAQSLAKTLAQSSLLPADLRNKPADVLVQIITGHELGLGSMQSIRSIHIIQGKPTMSAELMVALVKRSPECIRFRLVESSPTVATYETERRNEGLTKLSFTMEEAKTAGLVKDGSGWKKYPAAMLRARAASALCRAVYPDLLLGVYEESEADEIRANDRAASIEQAAAAYREQAGAPASEQVVEGEVVAAPALDPQPLLAQIEQANSIDWLKGLVPSLQAAPAEHKDALRAAYNARQAKLNEAQQEA
jgi:hypothetical protein